MLRIDFVIEQLAYNVTTDDIPTSGQTVSLAAAVDTMNLSGPNQRWMAEQVIPV